MQECKLTGRRGCQVNPQMVVSNWQRMVGRYGVALGFLWHTASIWHWWHRKKHASPQQHFHPHHCREPRLPLYSVYLTAQLWEDNRAVKNQAFVSSRCGGLSVCAMNVDGSRFMVISSQGRQCYAGLGGHRQVKHKGES